MHAGYLLVESPAAHPGLVRLRMTEQPPAQPDTDRAADAANASGILHYCAYFQRLDLARMHAHTALRWRLVDIDAGLYRASPLAATVAVDSLDLGRQRIYIDPALLDDPAFHRRTRDRTRRRRWRDWLWSLVGLLALLLLIATASLFGF